MRWMVIAGLVTLAGCGTEPGRQAAPDNTASGAEPAASGDAAPMPEPEAEPSAERALTTGKAESTPEPKPAATILSPLQGRWGLTPADCTSTRGDAKGLLQVSDTQLRFYESRAVLNEITEQDAARIVADFSFQGEGQTWRRRMTLDAQDGGRTLVRRDHGIEAMPEPLRYRRCQP